MCFLVSFFFFFFCFSKLLFTININVSRENDGKNRGFEINFEILGAGASETLLKLRNSKLLKLEAMILSRERNLLSRVLGFHVNFYQQDY